jgi:hypothetical protein
MLKYNEKQFNVERVETLLNDLDELDIVELVRIVGSLDRLAIEDGKPVYTEEQIGVIGKFVDFADDPNSEDEQEDDVEEEDENENDGDIPGTGEDPEVTVLYDAV